MGQLVESVFGINLAVRLGHYLHLKPWSVTVKYRKTGCNSPILREVHFVKLPSKYLQY